MDVNKNKEGQVWAVNNVYVDRPAKIWLWLLVACDMIFFFFFFFPSDLIRFWRCDSFMIIFHFNNVSLGPSFIYLFYEHSPSYSLIHNPFFWWMYKYYLLFHNLVQHLWFTMQVRTILTLTDESNAI